MQLVKIGYEIYGQQADIEVLQDYMEREKYHFALAELNTPRQGKHSKNDRIERMEPDLRGRHHVVGVEAVHDHRHGVETRQVRLGRRQMVVEVDGDAVAGVGAQHQRLDGHSRQQRIGLREIGSPDEEDRSRVVERAALVRARVVDELSARACLSRPVIARILPE